MNILVVAVVALGAGVGILASIIQAFASWQSHKPPLRFIIASIIFTIIFIIATYVYTSSSFASGKIGGVGDTLVSPTAQPMDTPTIPPTVVPTDTPTITPTDTPQPTDTPSPVPTLPPTPGPATRAATLPYVMNCQCGTNPVQVRITGVHIQSDTHRMTWDVTLMNIGNKLLSPAFSYFKLDLNGQSSYADNGGMVGLDNYVLLEPYGQSGYIKQSTITFTFTPQQATYKITAPLKLCNTKCDFVGYYDQPFTFQ